MKRNKAQSRTARRKGKRSGASAYAAKRAVKVTAERKADK